MNQRGSLTPIDAFPNAIIAFQAPAAAATPLVSAVVPIADGDTFGFALAWQIDTVTALGIIVQVAARADGPWQDLTFGDVAAATGIETIRRAKFSILAAGWPASDADGFVIRRTADIPFRSGTVTPTTATAWPSRVLPVKGWNFARVILGIAAGAVGANDNVAVYPVRAVT